ncbi:MAG: nitrogenase component 1 [Candidatus Gracilibacteria bacterium]|nr:nitrogenase component 1 [Candidatus Gracilibacteria bacterium]
MTNIDKKYSHKFNLTYLTGIILGTNAIKDAAVIIDGPNCSFFKADLIFNNHDIFSDLKDAKEGNKIFFTGVNIHSIVHGHEDFLRQKINEAFCVPKTKIAFLTAMPMVNLLGFQYESLIEDKSKVAFIKGHIGKDWIDGYESVLISLANLIDYKDKKVKKETVGIVGHLFDRNEGDCQGNVKELKRILKGIGLDITTIWLNGEDFNDLGKIKNSEYIISFPYGRKAAKIIQEKTGAKLLELDLPFSLESTIEFIRKIALATGKIHEGEKFIKQESKIVTDKLKPLIRRFLLDKNIIYGGEIQYIPGIINFCDLLGMNLKKIRGMCNEDKKNLLDKKLIKDYKIVLNSIYKIEEKDIDLLIRNSIFPVPNKEKYIELGFPSIRTHYLNNRPILGFNGVLNFVESLINMID